MRRHRTHRQNHSVSPGKGHLHAGLGTPRRASVGDLGFSGSLCAEEVVSGLVALVLTSESPAMQVAGWCCLWFKPKHTATEQATNLVNSLHKHEMEGREPFVVLLDVPKAIHEVIFPSLIHNGFPPNYVAVFCEVLGCHLRGR